jgi:hypothetical protein
VIPVQFLAPTAFVALLVPVAIYLIHWLSGSPRRIRVPALFLWADLPRAPSGRSRRKLPPLSLLLLLQVLLACAAVFALARPSTPSDPPRHLALIVDASASMQATDVSPTRFEAARTAALDRVGSLRPTEDIATVIRAGHDATLLSTGSTDAARTSLTSLQPGMTGAAIRDALAVASSQIAATPDRRGQIYLFTDASFAPLDQVGQLAAPVQVVATGGGSNNQALSALVVRMDPSGRSQTAFVEVANESDAAAHVPMRLTADGAPLDERQLDLPPTSRTRISIPLPADARKISVRLLGHDALALDDALDTLAPGGPPRNVVLLGRQSDGLLRAIESIPSLHLRPDPALADQSPPDLTVLQGVLPTQLPPGPLLLVDPPSTSARLLGVGLGSAAKIQQLHPLLTGLDLVALRTGTPAVSGVPGWAHVILGTEAGPLILEGRLEGHPVVALTFDPAVSGLEKSLAYPLLISNATSFLLAQADTAASASQPHETFDPRESDIAPKPLPRFAAVPQSVSQSVVFAERWQILIAAVLLLLAIEWLVFARRG